ncbi:MAG: hypothetical protein COB02_12540 [Candidatus Cloacimonadota bacterium]|nr:MAG: hypothetical protein COB02_12540 [Candidatus Cloacimonadota bacterium]
MLKIKENKYLNNLLILGFLCYWMDIIGVFLRNQTSNWAYFWLLKLQAIGSSSGIYDFKSGILLRLVYDYHYLIFLILSFAWFYIILNVVRKSPRLMTWCIGVAFIFGHGQSVLRNFGWTPYFWGIKVSNVVEYVGYNLIIITFLVFSIDWLINLLTIIREKKNKIEQ